MKIKEALSQTYADPLQLIGIIIGVDLTHLSFTTWKELVTASEHELTQLPNIGRNRAAQIKAIGMLMEFNALEKTSRIQIDSPTKAFEMFKYHLTGLAVEEIWVACLDTKNRVLDLSMVYRGNVDSSIVRSPEIYRQSVRLNASAIIMAHNHPTGDSTPSPQDVSVTCCVKEAGDVLGIELLDHLVIGDQSFTSLKERGLGFS